MFLDICGVREWNFEVLPSQPQQQTVDCRPLFVLILLKRLIINSNGFETTISFHFVSPSPYI